MTSNRVLCEGVFDEREWVRGDPRNPRYVYRPVKVRIQRNGILIDSLAIFAVQKQAKLKINIK